MVFNDIGKWWDGVLGGKKSKPAKRARKNPAKFERCVREVTASAKKHGYPLKSAYAVCNASMRRSNPHHHRDHHVDSRSYHEFGIRHAAGEIAEDVVQYGYSEGWHGKHTEVESVERLLKPFGIVYANELRGAWGVTRRNPADHGSKADENEWARRRNLPHIEVLHMSGKLYSTMVIRLRGKDIAEKTQFIRRGKVVGTTYFLPKLEGDTRTNPSAVMLLTSEQKTQALVFVRRMKKRK
jgi:hypothetical protein